MNINEEELQKSIETGSAAEANAADVDAYKKVFRALRKEPEIALSHNFADKIIARIIEKQKREEAKDLFWFGTGLFFLIVAFIATILYTGFSMNLGFLKDMSGYAGLLIFGIAFILVLHWIDKRILFSKKSY